jgi:phospholipase C
LRSSLSELTPNEQEASSMGSRGALVLPSFAAALAVVAAAWGSPPTPAARAVGRPAHRAAPPAHIVVVVEENHAFELETRHISWAAYLEGLRRPCSAVARSGAYTEAVDPFMHAADIRDHPSRCDRVLPFSRFSTNLAADRLPTVVFVMPSLRHEMHSGTVRTADRWLRRLVGELRASPVWRRDTRLVVTFDESRGRDVRSCCGGLGRGGRVATIVAGPRVPRGAV